jgi:hypothetical protein
MTKDEFIDGSIFGLEVWGVKLDGLDRRVADMRPARRPALRARVAALRRERRRLELMLREAARSPGAEWEDARPELQAAVREFRSLAAECSSLVGV